MSAGILRALMQLFAVISRGGIAEMESKSARDVVAMFLQQQLNRELVDRYLTVYDEFVEIQRNRSVRKKDLSAKRTSLSSVKVLRICTQINEELAQKEKYFVLIRLFEFIIAFEETTDQEWEFVATVADTFNIKQESFNQLKSLAVLKQGEVADINEFLYVHNEDDNKYGAVKSIKLDGLDGSLVFFRIEHENMFFLRYFGNEYLLLNGQSLANDRCFIFLQGASIRGSKISPLYYSDIIRVFLDESGTKRIVFRGENISYYFNRNNAQGLHQLNIVEESGNLIGIMGASGSGKSTLLNVLNGNFTPTYGKVTINGVDIHHEADKIEGVLGYIAQDDLLIEELTVFQNLYYNAKLCFGKKADENIVDLVEQTLRSVGLFEAKDLIVGSPLEKTISGGQRKRLNIALELIREPSVMFVDEPTSGLSSRDSENIMDLLKELTLKGKLIFVVIHQPSSDIFKMFDKLFILDQGGFPIYYGNPVESIIYFKRLVNHVNLTESECPRCGNVNPEQIFNIIESKIVDEYGNLTEHRKITPREWNNFFNVIIGNHIAQEDKELETPKSPFSVPKKLRQLGVFLTRDVLSKIANRQYVLINSIEAPLLAGVLALFIKFYHSERGRASEYIFRENENIPQFLFISVIVMLFLGLTVSAEEIIKDQQILKREKFLNLSKGSYLSSKISIMFIISAIQSFLYVLVGNSILEIEGMWLAYWAVLFSTSCFANLLGLNISASFNSAKVIYILIPILIIPQLLFSGVIVKFDKLYPLFASQSGVPWIGNVMASRWAYEALAVNQFKTNKHEAEIFPFQKKKAYYNWKKDYWLKELRGKVVESRKLLGNGENPENLAYNFRLIGNEFEKEIINVKGLTFEPLPMVKEGRGDSAVLDLVDERLDQLFEIYKRNYNRAMSKKDSVVTALTSTPENRDKYLLKKDKHYNEALEEFATNKNDLKKIVEYEEQLVQKSDPVYITPRHKTFLGTHFYAPSKKVFGKQLSTLSANLMVIWSMTVFLTIVLFLNGVKWIMGFISSAFSRLAGLFRIKVKDSYE